MLKPVHSCLRSYFFRNKTFLFFKIRLDLISPQYVLQCWLQLYLTGINKPGQRPCIKLKKMILPEKDPRMKQSVEKFPSRLLTNTTTLRKKVFYPWIKCLNVGIKASQGQLQIWTEHSTQIFENLKPVEKSKNRLNIFKCCIDFQN